MCHEEIESDHKENNNRAPYHCEVVLQCGIVVCIAQHKKVGHHHNANGSCKTLEREVSCVRSDPARRTLILLEVMEGGRSGMYVPSRRLCRSWWWPGSPSASGVVAVVPPPRTPGSSAACNRDTSRWTGRRRRGQGPGRAAG
jgi:hypothetical protein